jgi:hypothetical protein
MKKLILAIFVILSLGTLAEDSLPTMVVRNFNKLSQSEQYEDFQKNSKEMLGILGDYIQIDYLSGRIQIQRRIWDGIDLTIKHLLITALIVEIHNKTKSIDMYLVVDYTIVYSVIGGRVTTERVF